VVAISEFMEENPKYQCDFCEKEFDARDIIFVDAPTTRIELGAKEKYIFVNSSDQIIVAGYPPLRSFGDRVITCPHCNEMHPFGLTRVKKAA
jgi:hypothetical protein